jgi:hypothetical protein
MLLTYRRRIGVVVESDKFGSPKQHDLCFGRQHKTHRAPKVRWPPNDWSQASGGPVKRSDECGGFALSPRKIAFYFSKSAHRDQQAVIVFGTMAHEILMSTEQRRDGRRAVARGQKVGGRPGSFPPRAGVLAICKRTQWLGALDGSVGWLTSIRGASDGPPRAAKERQGQGFARGG